MKYDQYIFPIVTSPKGADDEGRMKYDQYIYFLSSPALKGLMTRVPESGIPEKTTSR
jgi:hypothetical protein